MWTDIPHRLFVFDCDGTLVDSQHNIIAAMGEACAALARGLPLPAHISDCGLTADMLSPARATLRG